MTLSATASNFGEMLEEAVKVADWVTADRCRERLVKLFVDAHQVGDIAAIAEIERHLSRGHALMVHLHGAPGVPDNSARGWMMSAEARVAAVAKLRARALAPELDQVALSKRDAILVALDLDGAGGNRKQLTNRDLARICTAAEATVARIMPVLRAEGLVTSVQRGAKRLNELTNAGRNEVYRIQQRSKPPRQANTESLEKFIQEEMQRSSLKSEYSGKANIQTIIFGDRSEKQHLVEIGDFVILSKSKSAGEKLHLKDDSNEIISKLAEASPSHLHH